MARRDHDRYDIPPRTSGKAIWSLVLGILSFGCTFLTGLPAIILGILGLRDANRSDGHVTGQGLAIFGIITGAIGSLVSTGLFTLIGFAVVGAVAAIGPAMQKVQDAAKKMESMNNLMQVGMAMHAYHDQFGHLPPAAITDKAGKPLLSWRVAILPQIGEDALYRQFKLDEPWDSPNNKPLIAQMPRIYFNPKAPPTEVGSTYYQVLVGPGTAFEAGKKIKLTDLTDGTSNTILVVEGANAVPWTKPDDIPYQPSGPVPPLGDFYGGGYLVLMGDGSTPGVSKKASEQSWKAAISRNGGEPLGQDFRDY
jgi:hypothetical protein